MGEKKTFHRYHESTPGAPEWVSLYNNMQYQKDRRVKHDTSKKTADKVLKGWNVSKSGKKGFQAPKRK